MIIYKATNKINDKIYIGKCEYSLLKRIYNHTKSINLNSTTYFHNAIRKYGIKCFRWKIIYSNDSCSRKDLVSKEIKYIKKFKSNIKKYGYNMTSGGDGGDTFNTHSETEKNNIRKKLAIASTGRRKDEHEIAKIINTQKGKIFTDEHKKKISIATKKAMMKPSVRKRYLKGLIEREKKRYDNK